MLIKNYKNEPSVSKNINEKKLFCRWGGPIDFESLLFVLPKIREDWLNKRPIDFRDES